MRYDLTDLKLLVHIAEARSLTRAAERCHLSVPSVSQRVRHLEESLGVPILQRQARGVELTQAGQVIERRALRILRELSCLHDELLPFAQGVYGEARLMATTVAMATFLPEALAVFLRQHPKINVLVEEANSWDILSATAANRIDLGVIAHRGNDASLAYQTLYRDNLLVLLPSGAPLASSAAIGFDALLQQHEFVGFGRLSAVDGFLDEAAAKLGKRRSVRAQVGTLEALVSMVAHDVGVAVVPQSLAYRLEPDPRVCVLPMDEEWASREISLCWLQNEEQPGYVAALRLALVDAAAAMSRLIESRLEAGDRPRPPIDF